MQVNIQKAYQYYIDNISKSCDTRILDEQAFHQAFAEFLNSLNLMELFQNSIKNIPVYNEKCKKSYYLNLEIVLNKVN